MHPVTQILIGLLLSLLGTALPLLMVIRVIPSTFFLNFSAFACMILGLAFGLLGAASYMRDRRK